MSMGIQQEQELFRLLSEAKINPVVRCLNCGHSWRSHGKIARSRGRWQCRKCWSSCVVSLTQLRSAASVFAVLHRKKLPGLFDLPIIPLQLLALDSIIRIAGRNHQARLRAWVLMLKLADVSATDIREFVAEHRNGVNVDVESLLEEDLHATGRPRATAGK